MEVEATRTTNPRLALPPSRFLPRRYKPRNVDSWTGHLAFANDLIAVTRPALIVELGTYWGEAYFTFCQSVEENGLSTRCYAVDHWLGDDHNGLYGEEVFDDVYRYNGANYRQFSYLLRMSFDDALSQFADDSIDLLHIDGLHTYDAVRHDFHTWLPKVRGGGIVLLHDTTARHSGFGVWRLWDEIKSEYRDTFDFHHSWGLGVVRKEGSAKASALTELLFRGSPAVQANVRRHYVIYASHLENNLGTVTSAPEVEEQLPSTLSAHVAGRRSEASEDQAAAGSATSYIDPGKIDLLAVQVRSQRDAVGELLPGYPGLRHRLAQFAKKVVQRSMAWYTRPSRVFNASVTQAIEGHGNAINSLQNQVLQTQRDFPPVRVAELATMERQAPYVEVFQGLSPVLDLGCGRGEFLELLKENEIAASGVDSDRLACDAARRKSLKVVPGDVLDHLRELPNRYLGGIFSSRVIEYLPPHLHEDLIALCAEKLKPGGVIVIETVNLESGHVGAIDPEVLRSLLESHGFRQSKICFLSLQEAPVAGATADEADGNPLGNDQGWSRARAYAAIAWRGC